MQPTRSRPIRACLAASIVAAAGMLAGAAHARGPGDEAAGASARGGDSGRRNVSLAFAGSDQDARLLGESLGELLGRLELHLVGGGSVVAPSSVLARVSVEMPEGAAAHVVVARADGTALLDRRVSREGSPSVLREQVAELVREAVESELRADPPPPPEPPPTPPPVAAPPRPPPPVAPPPKDVAVATAPASSSPLALDVTTFGAFGPIADRSGLVGRIGAGAELASRRGLRPAIGASFAYAPPFDMGGDLVTSHVRVASVRALASLEALVGSSVALRGGVGGGVDVLSVTPRSDVLPASTLRQETSRVDPVLSAAATVRYAFVQGVALSLTAQVDIDLASRAYVIDDGRDQDPVFAPWRLRPMLLAGFAFTALGEAAFVAERRP